MWAPAANGPPSGGEPLQFGRCGRLISLRFHCPTEWVIGNGDNTDPRRPGDEHNSANSMNTI
jgi:hypothetical protein